MEILIRLIITGALLGGGAAAVLVARRTRLKSAAGVAASDPVLSATRRGVPTILYFTSPICSSCKYAQEPALEMLRAELGEQVQIVTVDTTVDHETAGRWHVHTVPTTYVLDAHGTPVRVNAGVTDAPSLRKQLQSA